MCFVGAGPLKAVQLLETLIAHPTAELWRDNPHLVPHFFRRRRFPVVAHPPRNLGDDPQLVTRAFWWLHRLSAALNTTFTVRHRAFAFAPARGRRKNHVCELRRLREEDLLHDEMIQATQRLHD